VPTSSASSSFFHEESKSTDSLEGMESSENSSVPYIEANSSEVQKKSRNQNIIFVFLVSLIVVFGISYFMVKGRKNNHGEES